MGRAIAVLGMHRSGTSTVSGLLSTIGISLGPGDLIIPASTDNPKGFFEFHPFIGINDALLQRVNSSWDVLPSPLPDWAGDSAFQDLREEARRLVQRHFSHVPLWAFKDPRSCVTVPFWRKVIPDLSDAILVLRHPLEVADSLASRNSMPLDQSMALWLTYVGASIRGSSGMRRHILFYEDLLSDLTGEVGRLVSFIGLPALDEGRWASVMDFVTQDLRHHRRTKEELENRAGAFSQAVDLFKLIRSYVDLVRSGNPETSTLDRTVEGR